MQETQTWVRACSVDEVDEDEMLRLDTVPPVAVHHAEDSFYATADTCTHAESSLSEGYLEEGQVECVLHMARFCVRTGAALSLPATVPLRTFDVQVVNGEVFVQIDESMRNGLDAVELSA